MFILVPKSVEELVWQLFVKESNIRLVAVSMVSCASRNTRPDKPSLHHREPDREDHHRRHHFRPTFVEIATGLRLPNFVSAFVDLPDCDNLDSTRHALDELCRRIAFLAD